MSATNSKEFITTFERTINMAKAKVYSNISLERPLTETEFTEYKKLMNDLNCNV